MTPKEKAKELVYKIREDLFEQRFVKITLEDAVVCALIAVDEILKEFEELFEQNEPTSDNVWYLYKYYQEVKQEIEKL